MTIECREQTGRAWPVNYTKRCCGRTVTRYPRNKRHLEQLVAEGFVPAS